jgi:hypothetical protein
VEHFSNYPVFDYGCTGFCATRHYWHIMRPELAYRPTQRSVDGSDSAVFLSEDL